MTCQCDIFPKNILTMSFLHTYFFCLLSLCVWSIALDLSFTLALTHLFVVSESVLLCWAIFFVKLSTFLYCNVNTTSKQWRCSMLINKCHFSESCRNHVLLHWIFFLKYRRVCLSYIQECFILPFRKYLHLVHPANA